MITGDFLSMSLTTDNVRPSPISNAWCMGNLMMAGVIMGICLLPFQPRCFCALRRIEPESQRGRENASFVVLVFGSQATLYAIRQHQALVGVSSKPLARCRVRCRYRDSFDVGRRRNCNDTLAGLGGGWHACRSGSVRIRLGFRAGSGIRWSRDRPEPCAGRIARRRTVSIGWDGKSRGYRLGLFPLANTGSPSSSSSFWLSAVAVAGSIGQLIAPPPFTTRRRRSKLALSSAL